ncbi:putative bifunctional diguanylate cyclase/phosphodiesterase [uncultured Jatrophihabitans sp.]|uniref:putative bifunctional diguanylate cyclase/phosphodiesterase n=1 Tax=uncultured Jatrophihabitans sp. TaxID=1610747 RepID=UPI0035CB194A
MAAYFAVPSNVARDVIYLVIGLLSVGCIAAGVRLHRPALPGGWWAMALATFCFVGGDAILNYDDIVLHTEPFPSIADAFYLSGYPCLVLSVVLMTRYTIRRRREDRADAAIITLGALTLLWQVLVTSYAHDSTVTLAAKVVSIAYPVMDVGVLFVVALALFATRAKHASAVLVAVSLTALMIADIGYDLLELHGSYTSGNPIDAGWLISYGLLGVAALHPSMARRLPAAEGGPESEARLPLVAVAGLIAPGILLVSGAMHKSADLPVLGALSAVLFTVVIARVSWLLRLLRGQTVDLRTRSHELDGALTAQRALESDLRHQAFHDGLTGLANRALLQERVSHALLGSARTSGVVAMLLCDLDGFKTINDTLGHPAGDELLVAIAERLSAVVRAADTVARLGGDEFAVVMENVETPAEAMMLAERILSVVREPIRGTHGPISVTASIGVSFGTSSTSVEDLVSEADAAMYAAKAAGRDRVEGFATEMRIALVRELALRGSFDEALRSGQFHLAYQPHVSLHTGRLEGFEALARWRHPVYGDVGPVEFIPLAEETGFIVPLGRWVLEQACLAAASWDAAGAAPFDMSVNVSARQLQDPRFVDDVQSTLSIAGLPPSRLVLEVTESMLMKNPARTAALLSRLREAGVRVAIDDFGTGYSSLSHLQQFPIDIIKIDKSFVDPLASPSGEASAFVHAIVRLAHELRLATLAEGIEEPAQRTALIQLGCDSAQGYLLSKPLTPQDARALALDDLRREDVRPQSTDSHRLSPRSTGPSDQLAGRTG